jgi:hypothetical protein
MPDSTEMMVRSADTYRLHQDNLRWALLAGYAAFLAAVFRLSGTSDGIQTTVLVLIGICYMIILGVENYFYNLFAAYVKDCHANLATGAPLRTLKEFSEATDDKSGLKMHKTIGPFHHSFAFAMLIVLFGNAAIAHGACSPWLQYPLYVVDVVAFLSIFFAWRSFFFPHVVERFQKIFDVTVKSGKKTK